MATTEEANGAHSSTPRSISGPTSPQSSLLASGQSYVLLPTFTLESGVILHDVPLAYKTWGKLDPSTKDNALVVCHALTGSADVEDWWGPLLGPGKLFDPTRFFIVCANVLGSPYGSAGPCTRKHGEDEEIAEKLKADGAHWDGRGWWGPEFPATTVRDDVRIQKQLLDYLGVEQVAAVVGGSMGGMSVLEWGILFPVRFPSRTPSNSDETEPTRAEKPYIRAIVPIATAARHSAWCISWAEAQRQSIYSDPAYAHGYYDPERTPRAGLSAARMAALLTYRSRDSFESRFGRRIGGAKKGGGAAAAAASNSSATGSVNGGARRTSTAEEAAYQHNEGNQSPRILPQSQQQVPLMSTLVEGEGSSSASAGSVNVFSAQSYLRYQGDKFVKRFDANCYVHLTRKMDTHDVARGRAHWGLRGTAANGGGGGDGSLASPIDEHDFEKQHSASKDDNGDGNGDDKEVARGENRLPREGKEDDEALERVLALLSSHRADDGTRRNFRLGAPPPQVLVVSIESDGLFAPPEQALLHELIGGSKLVSIKSPDGHDGFLLEFEQINKHVEAFLREALGDGTEGQDIWKREKGVGWDEWKDWGIIPPGTSAGQAGKLGTGGEKVKESVFGEVEDVTRW
ncbi:homoserine O-acetyltransferase [Acaromyces ingoldii]|uniref:Homoserine O-acetyltransferase n=1 Tax=Acaromyces ingoldii TaxID=215250 RepID=A0A316YIL6_9BASI|nr:homoserine O-acetyltransferase [Acaromyces ingoldii]PWN87555.1 homoserine O-acetyltransferase [Acaromyces ingoldii]